jgi:hypothetical protein
MDSLFGTWYRLTPRGEAGLSCSRAGVALGPVPLIAARQGRYRLRSDRDLAEAFALAYGSLSPETFTRWHAGLTRIAKALERGEDSLAAIIAVQLGCPTIAPAAMAKLATSLLAKAYDPDQPRVPSGEDGAGEWTSNGGAGVQVAATSSRSARVDGHKKVVIQHENGSSEIRNGGTRSWRNNNPGSMLYGNFTRANGAIGQDGPFAIFPDADIGYQAMISRLSSPQWSSFTLGYAIIHNWAPANENDSVAYAAFVSSHSGLSPDTTLGSMSSTQINSVAQAIKQREGWKTGTVKILPSP